MTEPNPEPAETLRSTSRGEAYEPLTGRWSRLVAPKFLDWLDALKGGSWLDVGCGTGALIQAALDAEDPQEIVGVDPSSAYIAFARRQIHDPRVRYEVGSAADLPVASTQYDGVVAGLVLNHLSPQEQRRGVLEMTRAARYGGRVGAYVWDYANGMEPRVRFWEVATSLDDAASEYDERNRYAICNPEALDRLFHWVGLNAIQTDKIVALAHFEDFADYWEPFLAGHGLTGQYVASLPAEQRSSLERALRKELPIANDGSITMNVAAWAVKGVK